MTSLEYLIFDPSPCGFPKARISPLPRGFACQLLRAPSAAVAPSGFFRHYTRGRYALWEAYRLAGIGSGSTLLAPAYHCRTMLDPALALGGDVLLYPLREDLSPDLAALDGLYAQARQPVKALLATHFFGIPQQLEQLSAWCSARDIALIEDCSHVLFTENYRAKGTGASGAFAISSPYKFFPSQDGGLLYSRQPIASVSTPVTANFASELRGLIHLVGDETLRRRATAAGDIAGLGAELADIAVGPIARGHDSVSRQTTLSAEYRPGEQGLTSLRSSRFVARHADIEKIARCRRDNYRRWTEELDGLPHCRPLFPRLPEGCIPYMFPLYLDRPDPHFYWLKHLSVPVWRWDSIAASACTTATDYRLHLLHLPCHQSLTPAELQWMIAATKKVMQYPVPGAA